MRINHTSAVYASLLDQPTSRRHTAKVQLAQLAIRGLKSLGESARPCVGDGVDWVQGRDHKMSAHGMRQDLERKRTNDDDDKGVGHSRYRSRVCNLQFGDARARARC